MSSTISNSQLQLYYFLVIIALVLILRIRRTLHGQRFSNRIFTMPVLYALILLSFIYALTLDEILISVALAAAAIPVGMRASENPEFFFRDQTLYFKRSIMLTVMWIGGFLARTFLEIFYSTGNNFVDFVVTALLTLTLGLIIGERYVIYNKGKVIQQTGKINQSDEFVPKGDRSN